MNKNSRFHKISLLLHFLTKMSSSQQQQLRKKYRNRLNNKKTQIIPQ